MDILELGIIFERFVKLSFPRASSASPCPSTPALVHAEAAAAATHEAGKKETAFRGSAGFKIKSAAFQAKPQGILLYWF